MAYLSNKLTNAFDLGWFATPEALKLAYPIGANGYFAMIGSTDTIWVWDEDTNDWVNSNTPGPIGPTGPTGPTGATGPQGPTGATGSGTVSSVAVSVPVGLVVSGSPVTNTGTIAISLDTGRVIPLQSYIDAKITGFADPGADRIVFWDDSAGAYAALTASTGLTLTGTNLTVRAASSTVTGIIEIATDAETVTGSSTTLATTPANITARLASPSSIGSTAPNTGKFTSVETTGNIELGHATDTTISRVSAGVIAVEGVILPTISSTNTLTNKRVTKRVVTTTQAAEPTINTDNGDIFSITALAQAITSFTTNLTGTPVEGDMIMIQITDNGTPRAITWGASFTSTTTALPTTTVASTMLRVVFQYNTTWQCVAVS